MEPVRQGMCVHQPYGLKRDRDLPFQWDAIRVQRLWHVGPHKASYVWDVVLPAAPNHSETAFHKKAVSGIDGSMGRRHLVVAVEEA